MAELGDKKMVELTDDDLDNVNGGLNIMSIFNSFVGSFIKSQIKDKTKDIINNGDNK